MHFSSSLLALSAATITLAAPQQLLAPSAGTDAHLSIGTWSVPGCPGNAAVTKEIGYVKGIPAGKIVSYQFSRALEPHEIVTFSGADCKTLVETVNPDTNGNMLHGSTCYSFLHGATAGCVTVTGS